MGCCERIKKILSICKEDQQTMDDEEESKDLFSKWITVNNNTWYHPKCQDEFSHLAKCYSNDIECEKVMDVFRQCQKKAINNPPMKYPSDEPQR